MNKNLKNKKRALIIAASWAGVLLIVDQITKMWAIRTLGGREIPVVGDILSLKLVFNAGAAFSLGAGFTWVFTLVAFLVCCGLPVYIARQNNTGVYLALAAVWAGACGNLIDRLFRQPGFGHGHVVDFISYNDFFVGNVADIELVVGVAAFVILELLSERKAESSHSLGIQEKKND